MENTEKVNYLELSDDPIRFDPINQLTNVFFDNTNKDIFSVRSGGVMGVVVQGPSDTKPLQFCLDDCGTILSIKFSTDHKILSIQRIPQSIILMNFDGKNLDTHEYSVCSKKNADILGFVWVHSKDPKEWEKYKFKLVIVTQHSIELHVILPEKQSSKLLKSTSITVDWFVWCPVNNIALLAASHGSQLQPVIIKSESISKLSKVDTEPGRMASERDVTLATLYGTPAILILRHQAGSHPAEVHVHMLNGPGQAPVKSHVLKLGLLGGFSINIVDNLIIIHHKQSKTSRIFDINVSGETDGIVKYHQAIAPADSFKETSIVFPGLMESEKYICELYSSNWVVFQPDIVIHAKLGCLWHVKLCLMDLCSQIKDFSVCTEMVLKRDGGEAVLLKLLLDAVNQEKPELDDLQKSFNHINSIYKDYLDAKKQSRPKSPDCQPTSDDHTVLIDQNLMFNEIFQKMNVENNLVKAERIIMTYLNSLSKYSIPAQPNLNQLIITILAQQNKFTTLQQLLHYGVISDSKQIAIFLLSLGNMHASAIQMALDMFIRIDAREEIQEVLLSEGQILTALKVAQDTACARKFLEAAQNTDDCTLFHSVLYYFRNNPQFAAKLKKEEKLDSFINEYNTMFHL